MPLIIMPSPRAQASLNTLEPLWPGFSKTETADGITYNVTYRCPANKLMELKPHIYDPCPENSDAQAQSVTIDYKTPDWIFISVTYSTFTITYSADQPVGTKESDMETIQSTAVDSEGTEYSVVHNVWVYKTYTSKWGTPEQYYATTITDTTNNAYWRLYSEMGERWYPPYTWRIIGVTNKKLSAKKYLVEIRIQYNPLYWNTNRYAPIDFDAIFDPFG